jgi:hypothetical protein
MTAMSDHGSTHDVRLGSGLPTTVLPVTDPEVRRRLAEATALDPTARRDAVAAVVADHPRELEAWAALGDAGRDPVERYAAYRIGYHRGLDALRANGWRGTGYVRWASESNHGFLRSLLGLQRMAGAIGETDEEERCRLFLAQLDPSGVPEPYASAP